MTLYGLPFEHRPWSVFGDAEKIRPYNPLVRVPTLVLDDGEVLMESHSILDYLDGRVDADRRLFPVSEPARHQALRVAALATGTGEKAVSLFYEKRLHREVSDVWVERCRSQIFGNARRARSRPHWAVWRLLVRRLHRPCRHRGRRGAALHLGRASRPGRRWPISRPSPPTPNASRRCRYFRRFRSPSSRRPEGGRGDRAVACGLQKEGPGANRGQSF